MQKLQSTYDGCLIYKASYEECKVFLGMIHSQKRKTSLRQRSKISYTIFLRARFKLLS